MKRQRMTLILKTLSLVFVSKTVLACPEIEGDWTCYEKNFEYTYQENFKIERSQTVWTYLQTLTDDAGVQPTFDKITDNLVRTVSHIALGENEYIFRQNSFCPDEKNSANVRSR